MILGVPLIAAVAANFICQLFKVVFYSIRQGGFRPDTLVRAGGMPSAHSAMVSALTTSVGLYHGLSSTSFAIAAVFSLIIVHDAARLRGAVQLHAEVLGRLARHFPEEVGKKIPARIGHSPVEVLVGVATGIVSALLVYLLFPTAVIA